MKHANNMTWTVRKGNHPSNNALYARGIMGKRDGDEFGNEWFCGFAIYSNALRGSLSTFAWQLYEDDGTGNGDLISEGDDIFNLAAIAMHIDMSGG